MTSESMDARFDGLLSTIAQQCGGIDPLFDTFFGFLARKTDYFSAKTEYCHEIMEQSFKKWSNKWKEMRQRLDAVEAAEAAEAAAKSQKNAAKKVVEQKEIPKFEEVNSDDEDLKPTNQKKSAANLPQNSKLGKETDEEEDEESSNRPPPEGNGGLTSKYRWTQTLDCVEIYIFLPEETQSKNCIIKITPTHLQVGVKGQPLIIDGEFHMKIKAEESMWTIVDRKLLQISIEKVDNMRWWSCVIIGDPEIDTKTIVPESSRLSDLDQETRSTVEKMMFDQRQKESGLPTSDQRQQAELLEKFKKSHPELDFSNAKINWGNAPFPGPTSS